MKAAEIKRGTVLGGVRVERTGELVQHGQRMVLLHLADGTTRTLVPGAAVEVTPTRRRELPAAVVRAPKRTEILPAIEERQTPRGNGRRGLTTRRTA